TKEYSPEELASFEDSEATEEVHEEGNATLGRKCLKTGLILTLLGILTTLVLYYMHVDKEVYILSAGLLAFGVFEIIAGILQKNGTTKGGLVEIVNDLNAMPKTMKQLALVQFFSWFALFAMWIYTTPAVTEHIYNALPGSLEYNEGANWVGICFGVYNGLAAVFAFLLIALSKITNRKITHTISLLVGGVSFISIYFITNSTILLIPFIGIGLVWASILAMPYAILTGSLPSNKMGIYMGILNFFIVIPQIVAASILGFFIKSLFNNESIWALVLGGISMILAGILVVFVKDED
ncbi:MAG: MFS transporter, partial [Marinilabiliales bacterium]